MRDVSEEAVQKCVEAVCQNGCTVVRAVIAALENGVAVAELADLRPGDRRQVLEELRSIMAVYDRR